MACDPLLSCSAATVRRCRTNGSSKSLAGGGGTFNKFPSKVYPVPRGQAPPLHFASSNAHLLATTEAAAGSAPVRVSSVVLHGRTLRLHAELGQEMVIDAPRRAEGFQFSVGDVAHISLRRGANCPMLPS